MLHFISIVKNRKIALVALLLSVMYLNNSVHAQTLWAGTGKSNITGSDEYVHDSLFVKTLILKNKNTSLAIITLDVVAVERIGFMPDDYYPNVKNRLKKEFKIDNVLINASHNHFDDFLAGKKMIVDNVEEKTIQTVRIALKNIEKVKVGAGSSTENRISMNRRIKLKDGTVYTIRHANPNMPDEEVVGIGAIDPEIGILRLERFNGIPKALVYNFACHPYTGVPDRGVTAEFPGFASKTIEDDLGHNSMAFFLQGAAGDITEIMYKTVSEPRNSEVFGRMLGESTLKGYRKIKTEKTSDFNVINEKLKLPARKDITRRIDELNKQEQKLLASLRSSSLNMKTFIPLYIKYKLSPEYPSYYSYLYLKEKKDGRQGYEKLDEMNRKNLDKYVKNMLAMDKLAQIEENKAFLKIKQKELDTLGDSIAFDIMGVRIGDFVLVTLPAEAFARIGLDIKKNSPFEHTFMACYTNGYFHYAPDADSYKEWGYEVMNTLLAPEWQNIYEKEIAKILKDL